MIVGDLLSKTWCNTNVKIVSEKHGCEEYTVHVLRDTRQDIMREFIEELDVIQDDFGSPCLYLRLVR
mgnify:CR=1 FL=1